MSDTLRQDIALDPDRPWITDERQLPGSMNWFSTLFNPAGKSPTLHFTRAWTLLFMLQLFCVFGLSFIIGVVSLTGADTGGFSLFQLYLTAVVFVVTTVISFVIHCRRLNDAGKINIRAFVILIPLLIATAAFVSQVQGKAAEYQELYAERSEYLADPEGWETQKLEARRKAQEERVAEEAARAASENDEEGAQGDRGGQNRGGQRGRGGQSDGPSADKELPSQEEFILRPNVGVFQQYIMPISAFIMIWSLLWVARVPYFGGKGQEQTDAPYV